MNRPVSVKPLPGYKIWVKFSDGAEGEVDLTALAGKGVFARWRSRGVFETVHIDPERGTVAWDDEIDLCPDSLYMEITGDGPEKVFPALKSRAVHA